MKDMREEYDFSKGIRGPVRRSDHGQRLTRMYQPEPKPSRFASWKVAARQPGFVSQASAVAFRGFLWGVVAGEVFVLIVLKLIF